MLALSKTMSPPRNETDYGPPRHRVVPLMVASLLTPQEGPGARRDPYGMVLTLDVDAIPGLRDVFTRQRGGATFDVVSRWGAAIDNEEDETPLVLVDFYLPEVELAVEIAIDVDDNLDSLLVGIRSGTVVLVDEELSLAFQKTDIATAFAEYQPLVIQPPDPKPAIGVIQQRHELPVEAYQPERREVTPGTSHSELEQFIENTTVVLQSAIQYHRAGTPTIVLVDPGVAPLQAAIAPGAEPEGRWALLAGDKHNVMRFDAFLAGRSLGRWLLFNPAEAVIRAGASGAHMVMLLAVIPSRDQETAEQEWQEGISVWCLTSRCFASCWARSEHASSNELRDCATPPSGQRPRCAHEVSPRTPPAP